MRSAIENKCAWDQSEKRQKDIFEYNSGEDVKRRGPSWMTLRFLFEPFGILFLEEETPHCDLTRVIHGLT